MLILGQKSCILGSPILKFHNPTDIIVFMYSESPFEALIEMMKWNKIKFYLTRSIFFCFRGASDPIYKAIWADNKSFDEVLISKRMVQDHMPDNVLGALEKVRFTKWGQGVF